MRRTGDAPVDLRTRFSPEHPRRNRALGYTSGDSLILTINIAPRHVDYARAARATRHTRLPRLALSRRDGVHVAALLRHQLARVLAQRDARPRGNALLRSSVVVKLVAAAERLPSQNVIQVRTAVRARRARGARESVSAFRPPAAPRGLRRRPVASLQRGVLMAVVVVDLIVGCAGLSGEHPRDGRHFAALDRTADAGAHAVITDGRECKPNRRIDGRVARGAHLEGPSVLARRSSSWTAIFTKA